MGIVGILLLVLGIVCVILGVVRLVNRSWVDGAVLAVLGLVLLGVGGFLPS